MICFVIFTAKEKERIKMKMKNFCRTWQVTDEKTEAWKQWDFPIHINSGRL
jgi:hypothetical protein